MEFTADGQNVGLLFSAGLDSSILLSRLAEIGQRVQPFYVRCGLAWELAEWTAARQYLAAIGSKLVNELVVLDLPLADVYGNHWSVTGTDVPPDDSPDEAVYLPARNPLLAIKPAVWCQLHGISRLALAVTKANPFPDATRDFFARLGEMLSQATGREISFELPFALMHKQDVMELGQNYPLHLSFSCISPQDNLHCGKCNKCAERRAAFAAIGLPDRTAYSA
jgi:7-cyano-7-deazaguanine synthase